MIEENEYSTILAKESIKIDDVSYEIRELTFGARQKYLKQLNQTMEVRMVEGDLLDAKGEPVMRKEILIKDLSGSQRVILLNTMFNVSGDVAKLIGPYELDGWGARMVEKFTAVSNSLNGMGESDKKQGDVAEKN